MDSFARVGIREDQITVADMCVGLYVPSTKNRTKSRSDTVKYKIGYPFNSVENS